MPSPGWRPESTGGNGARSAAARSSPQSRRPTTPTTGLRPSVPACSGRMRSCALPRTSAAPFPPRPGRARPAGTDT
eukprot:7956761-Alexandrium_andersonii.AAC.1